MAYPKTLVVYYSRTGHTEAVAREVARQMGGDLEAIDAGSFARGSLWYLRAAWASLTGRPISIAPPARRPQDFDLVILAAPIWMGRPCPPIRAYLRDHAGVLPAVALVITHGGGDASLTIKKLETLAGNAPVAQVTCSDPERKSGAEKAKIAAFIDALRLPKKATAA